MEDVQSYMEDAALTEARAELLKVKFRYEEERSRSSALEGTVAAMQKQITALENNKGGTNGKTTNGANHVSEHELAATQARCVELEETLKAVENGPTGEMIASWEQERCELLSGLEEAEDRILRMQGQMAEKDSELSKLKRAVENLNLEKQALQNDAMELSDRQMELVSANRMLANELQQQQHGLGRTGTAELSPAVSAACQGSGIGRGKLEESAEAAATTVAAKPIVRKGNVVDLAQYEEVVAELAHRKLEIAFGQEREAIMKNALSKGRERYHMLQQRLTRIEASMYSRTGSASPAVRR